jgi:acetyl-CoA carboxylase beta subunit
MAFEWFKRKAQNITTSTDEKKDVPKGLWHQTPSGKIVENDELKRNNYVSPEDGFHVRIGSAEFLTSFLMKVNSLSWMLMLKVLTSWSLKIQNLTQTV